jgi:hypothetical protein
MREEPLILSVKKDGSYHLARQAVPSAGGKLSDLQGHRRKEITCERTRTLPTAPS